MRGIYAVVVSIIAALLVEGGCAFGPTRFKGVMSYRSGRVYLKHDRYYRVGKLPRGWRRMKTKARAISFYNRDLKSSISTDAFCGASVGDRPLDSLGGEVISALDERKVVEEVPFTLDGRGALRQRAEGNLDGVSVVLDLVVIKKSGCVFDMYAIMPPEFVDEVAEPFETFFRAFHYE